MDNAQHPKSREGKGSECRIDQFERSADERCQPGIDNLELTPGQEDYKKRPLRRDHKQIPSKCQNVRTPMLSRHTCWNVVITYVTFRDMGAAFAVAIVAIYILVVAQFGTSNCRW